MNNKHIREKYKEAGIKVVPGHEETMDDMTNKEIDNHVSHLGDMLDYLIKRCERKRKGDYYD